MAGGFFGERITGSAFQLLSVGEQVSQHFDSVPPDFSLAPRERHQADTF